MLYFVADWDYNETLIIKKTQNFKSDMEDGRHVKNYIVWRIVTHLQMSEPRSIARDAAYRLHQSR